jgi:peptidoglycan hydrolase CwlO-like protein
MPRKIKSTTTSTTTTTKPAIEAAIVKTSVENKVESYDHTKLEKQIADLQKEVNALARRVGELSKEKVELRDRLEASVSELRENARNAALNVAVKADDRLDDLIATLNSDRRFAIKFRGVRAARRSKK